MTTETNSHKSSVQRNRLVVLPFKKAIEISFKNIQVRFFRSLITTLSLMLAVSFLSFTNISIDIADGLLAGRDEHARESLVRAGYDITPGDTSVGSTAKQRWIVILSLVVCVVGIVNAQLIAVTERFREIGTMKCLGALDRFVVKLFFLEAGMQGVAGGAIGALGGAIFALLNAILVFGTTALVSVPWLKMLVSMLNATGVGILLSLIGVFYPAIIAARMQPIEAMRVEQ
ncbi:MAG: FtsX-like permease family protein [Deltaproteobacteria bacterium]|nr:FtsX-like permease family protein [Deltaproteobacteria bacterium]